MYICFIYIYVFIYLYIKIVFVDLGCFIGKPSVDRGGGVGMGHDPSRTQTLVTEPTTLMHEHVHHKYDIK